MDLCYLTASYPGHLEPYVDEHNVTSPLPGYVRPYTTSAPAMSRFLNEQGGHAPWIFGFDSAQRHPAPWSKFPEPEVMNYGFGPGLSSPAYGEDSSIGTYSTYEDGRGSPSLSSEIHGLSPDVISRELLLYTPEAHVPAASMHRQTISMHDVQLYADAQPELGFYDDESMAMLSVMPQEGYHPLYNDHPEEVHMAGPSYEMPVSNHSTPMSTTQHPDDCPVLRHRRSSPRSQAPTRTNPNRINKRTPLKRAATNPSSSSANVSVGSFQDDAAAERPFHCPLAPYGCTSTFGSKNEWKRHFSTQHLRLGYWRCDQCPSAGKRPNDFNRKDLFVQHVRRMHPSSASQTTAATTTASSSSSSSSSSGRKNKNKHVKNDDPDGAVTEAASRCYKRLRSPPPESICVVCSQDFKGNGSWDERMEHIGRHFESSKESSIHLDVSAWEVDSAVETWMVREGILAVGDDGSITLVTEDGRN